MHTINNYVDALKGQEGVTQPVDAAVVPEVQSQVVAQPVTPQVETPVTTQSIQPAEPISLDKQVIEGSDEVNANIKIVDGNLTNVSDDIDKLFEAMNNNGTKSTDEILGVKPNVEVKPELNAKIEETVKKEVDNIDDINTLKEKYRDLKTKFISNELESQGKDVKINLLEKALDQERLSKDSLLDEKKTLERDIKKRGSQEIDSDLVSFNDNFRLFKENKTVYNERRVIGEIVKIAESLTSVNLTPFIESYLNKGTNLSEESGSVVDNTIPKGADKNDDLISKLFT